MVEQRILERQRIECMILYILLIVLPVPFTRIGIIILGWAFVRRYYFGNTIYLTHLSNIISIVLIETIGAVLGYIFGFLFIGAIFNIVLFIYVLYRSVKGLVACFDVEPYL